MSSTGRKEAQIEFTAINVYDPIDVTKSTQGATDVVQMTSSSPLPSSTCKEKCTQSVESLVSKVAELLDKADLQNSSVDSRDLHKYKAKIPILLLYFAAFVASFAGLFSYSFTTDMSTKFLSPKDPKAADKPNCKSDQISITGAYQIDTNGNWQGTEAFQPSRVAYEFKFKDFHGSYDDWKTITYEFETDLNRVRDTSLGMRNGQGDLAYSLLIPASYSFFKQMSTGSVQIYLRADASYLFNNDYKSLAQGSMTGYQKNNTETPCFSTDVPCSKFGKLTAVAPGEIDTSYDVARGGRLTFAVPTFKTNVRSILPNFKDDDDDGERNDDPNWNDQSPYNEDLYVVTLPASSFLTNLMHHYYVIYNMKAEKNNGVDDLKFHYDMRSVTTALAVNNGLASVKSLKSLGPVDVASMDPEDFDKQYKFGEDIQLGKYTDPYYEDMEPILCLSAPFIRDVLFKFREYFTKKNPIELNDFESKYMVYLEDIMTEIEANDQRHMCFVKSTVEYLKSTEVDPSMDGVLSFWSFPTMNQLGSWSDKKYIPDEFVDDDTNENHFYYPTDIKDECWFPAYGRYDGLYPGDQNTRQSYLKYASYDYDTVMRFPRKGGRKILISFLHVKSYPTFNVYDILSCTKLMHEMLSSYSTMEERFYSLYTENAATAGLNMLARAPARGYANHIFYEFLYSKWIDENEIRDEDPLNYKFINARQDEDSMNDDGAIDKYGLRDVAKTKYPTLVDIKAREDFFLNDYLYGDHLTDKSNYYEKVSYSATDTNWATRNYVIAGPYHACPSENEYGVHFTMRSNGGSSNGSVYMRLFDESGNQLLVPSYYNDYMFYSYTDPSKCKNLYLHLGV